MLAAFQEENIQWQAALAAKEEEATMLRGQQAAQSDADHEAQAKQLAALRTALELAQRARRLLREAGCGAGRVAASSVICSENGDGMPALWRYLREREILPYFEMMTPQGRMLENRHLMVELARLRQVFEEIAAIDAQFGFCWEPQPPLVGGKCFRHIYSCLVNASGDVMPCVGVTTKLGSAAERPVRDILFDSSVIRDLKNYRKMIKGPCRTCRKAQECYGCRGAAYQMTVDYLP